MNGDILLRDKKKKTLGKSFCFARFHFHQIWQFSFWRLFFFCRNFRWPSGDLSIDITGASRRHRIVNHLGITRVHSNRSTVEANNGILILFQYLSLPSGDLPIDRYHRRLFSYHFFFFLLFNCRVSILLQETDERR